jgi:hypothetical protein
MEGRKRSAKGRKRSAKPRIGEPVFVEWLDISATQHSEEDLEPVKAMSLGWVNSFTRVYLRLTTSGYPVSGDFEGAIPTGCITRIVRLECRGT